MAHVSYPKKSQASFVRLVCPIAAAVSLSVILFDQFPYHFALRVFVARLCICCKGINRFQGKGHSGSR